MRLAGSTRLRRGAFAAALGTLAAVGVLAPEGMSAAWDGDLQAVSLIVLVDPLHESERSPETQEVLVALREALQRRGPRSLVGARPAPFVSSWPGNAWRVRAHPPCRGTVTPAAPSP